MAVEFVFRGRRMLVGGLTFIYEDRYFSRMDDRDFMDRRRLHADVFEVDKLVSFWGVEVLCFLQPIINQFRNDIVQGYCLKVDLESGGYWWYLLGVIVCDECFYSIYDIGEAEGDDERIMSLADDFSYIMTAYSPNSGLAELVQAYWKITDYMEEVLLFNPGVKSYSEFRKLENLIREVRCLVIDDV